MNEMLPSKIVMRVLVIVLIVGTLLIAIVSMTGCNKQWFDTTYKFDYAYISLPNGKIVEGKVDSWSDFDDGDQLQITINENTYLTHATNVVLIDYK